MIFQRFNIYICEYTVVLILNIFLLLPVMWKFSFWTWRYNCFVSKTLYNFVIVLRHLSQIIYPFWILGSFSIIWSNTGISFFLELAHWLTFKFIDACSTSSHFRRGGNEINFEPDQTITEFFTQGKLDESWCPAACLYRYSMTYHARLDY